MLVPSSWRLYPRLKKEKIRYSLSAVGTSMFVVVRRWDFKMGWLRSGKSRSDAVWARSGGDPAWQIMSYAVTAIYSIT